MITGTVPTYRRKLLLAAIGVALAGMNLMPSAVTASETDVLAETEYVRIVQDGAWTTYEYTDPLEETKRQVYSGLPLPDGTCEYSGQETIDPETMTAPIIEEREVASNDATCVMVTEVGVPGSDRIDDRAAGGEYTEESAAPTVYSEPSDGDLTELVGVAGSVTTRAWHKTYYEDPPGADVNSAKTNVTWTANGKCVTDSWGHKTNYGWLKGTGWRKDWSNTSASRRCGGATTTSNSHFSNGVFCMGVDTHTEYVPNGLRGEENGTYTMWWTARKWGGCNRLLSFHRSHGWAR